MLLGFGTTRSDRLFEALGLYGGADNVERLDGKRGVSITEALKYKQAETSDDALVAGCIQIFRRRLQTKTVSENQSSGSYTKRLRAT